MQEVSRCHFVEEKLQAALPKVTDFRNINQASRSKGEARDPEASEDPEVEVENLDDSGQTEACRVLLSILSSFAISLLRPSSAVAVAGGWAFG